MMRTISGIVFGTPWWVWILLAFLLYRGISALKSSMISLVKLFILPTILISLSIQGLLASYGLQAYPVAIWTGASLIGILLGWLLIRNANIQADKKRWLIKIPGTTSTLIIILMVFGLRYYFGYTAAVNLALLNITTFITFRYTVSGLASGILIGRLFGYL